MNDIIHILYPWDQSAWTNAHRMCTRLHMISIRSEIKKMHVTLWCAVMNVCPESFACQQSRRLGGGNEVLHTGPQRPDDPASLKVSGWNATSCPRRRLSISYCCFHHPRMGLASCPFILFRIYAILFIFSLVENLSVLAFVRYNRSGFSDDYPLFAVHRTACMEQWGNIFSDCR